MLNPYSIILIDMKKALNAVVYDDSPVFSFGLTTMLRNIKQIQSVVELSSIFDFAEVISESEIDVALIGLTNLECCEVIISASKRNSHVKIIALINKIEALYSYRLRAIKADGFLLRDSTLNEIKMATFEVVDGRNYYSSPILNKFNINKSNYIESKRLTLSEKNILYVKYLLFHEKTSKEIAGILNLSVRTVEEYRTKILRSTNSANMIGVLKAIIEEGIHTDEILISKFAAYCKRKNHKGIDYITQK
jgi:DNA-binding NarL/FixJ family response regulator